MHLIIIAHNIRSAENVGSLLRTADALGIGKVFLTGYSPNANHPKVKKTALGAELAMAHEQVIDIAKLLEKLKSEEYHILGLELDDRAIALDNYKPRSQKVALLLGNEVDGIPSYLRDKCQELIYIPMKGIKESLNVTIATAIASWHLTQSSKKIKNQ